MLNNTVRIGVLGTASIAKKYIIPTLLAMPEHFNVVGVASRDKAKAVAFANSLGIQAFETYESLLTTDSLDAIYIPLPNSLHYEWVKKSLLKGLHVIVEKSLACSLEEVVELNQLALDKQLVLVENFQFRFHSQLTFIKRLISEGKIGELRCLRSSFGFPPFNDSQNIRYDKKLGGGALLDAGAYPVKVSQLFLGYDIEVSASSLHFDKNKSIDVWGGAFLKEKTGSLFAEIAFGFDNYYQCDLELWGSTGRISTNRTFTAPPGYQPEVLVETTEGSELVTLDADHHFNNMFVHFNDLIDNRYKCQEEYEQNIHQARLLQEIHDKALNYV